jgi:hypothetical protein
MAVAAFLDAYRAALESFDAERVADFYRLPLPVTRPDRVRLVEARAELVGELAKILDFYRWAGMTTVELARLRHDGFDPGLDIASLTWRPLDRSGEAIAAIDVTFAIRRTLDGAKIAAVIAHNEERRRLPIMRDSLVALESQT